MDFIAVEKCECCIAAAACMRAAVAAGGGHRDLWLEVLRTQYEPEAAARVAGHLTLLLTERQAQLLNEKLLQSVRRLADTVLSHKG